MSPDVSIQHWQYMTRLPAVLWLESGEWTWTQQFRLLALYSTTEWPDLPCGGPKLTLIEGKKQENPPYNNVNFFLVWPPRHNRTNTIEGSWRRRRKDKINTKIVSRLAQAGLGRAGINGTNWTMKVCCRLAGILIFIPLFIFSRGGWETKISMTITRNKIRKVLSFYLNVFNYHQKE